MYANTEAYRADQRLPSCHFFLFPLSTRPLTILLPPQPSPKPPTWSIFAGRPPSAYRIIHDSWLCNSRTKNKNTESLATCFFFVQDSFWCTSTSPTFSDFFCLFFDHFWSNRPTQRFLHLSTSNSISPFKVYPVLSILSERSFLIVARHHYTIDPDWRWSIRVRSGSGIIA